MSVSCSWGFHNWSRWEPFGKLHKRGDEKAVIAFVQQRECVRCGLKQIKQDFLKQRDPEETLIDKVLR